MNTTVVASVMAIISVNSVSCSEARIVVEQSRAIAISVSAGIAACGCGNSAFTPSIVLMMSAPGCGNRMTSTDRPRHAHRGIAVPVSLLGTFGAMYPCIFWATASTFCR